MTDSDGHTIKATTNTDGAGADGEDNDADDRKIRKTTGAEKVTPDDGG